MHLADGRPDGGEALGITCINESLRVLCRRLGLTEMFRSSRRNSLRPIRPTMPECRRRLWLWLLCRP